MNTEQEMISAWDRFHAAVIEAMNFQGRVGEWMMKCFGADITNSAEERANRFQEESNELSQAMGMTRERAHELVDYTWDRPAGDPRQEIGGVMVTLAALCHARGYDMMSDGEAELARIETPEMIAKIRAKHHDKVLRIPESALPGQVADLGATSGYMQAPTEPSPIKSPHSDGVFAKPDAQPTGPELSDAPRATEPQWKALGAALCSRPGGSYQWPPVGGAHPGNREYIALHGNEWHLPTISAAHSPAYPDPIALKFAQRHDWAQPGDVPHRTFVLQFDDEIMGNMVWTGEDASTQALAAWRRYAPSWNCTLFMAVRTVRP